MRRRYGGCVLRSEVEIPVSEYVGNEMRALRIVQSMEKKLTCWLIKSTAMSFLSWVKFWKACSISEVSVLESTTRKFLWEPGGSVTCCKKSQHIRMASHINVTET